MAYIAGMYASHRYEKHPRWQPVDPEGEQRLAQVQQARQNETEGTEEQDEEAPREASRQEQVRRKYADTPLKRIYLYFAAGAAGILVAGWLITQAADALAKQTGLGGSLIGFVLLAIATSLPEVSTTYTAVKFGSYAMAISNILGGNAFDTTMLFVADVVYREGPILRVVEPWAGFAAGLGIILTIFYLWGLVERRDRTIFGMGIASALVLATYVAGLVILYQLTSGGGG
ncbi:MAG TPA: hypothetical protein VGW38_06570 [Chloroflexota bacterium]|nr:hypothetical protein [Chloroflexota bacterium]